MYACIRFKDARETSVSLTDLAPRPRNTDNAQDGTNSDQLNGANAIPPGQLDTVEVPITENVRCEMVEPVEQLRRSTRFRKKPERYGFSSP
eukprot:gene8780-14810_t